MSQTKGNRTKSTGNETKKRNQPLRRAAIDIFLLFHLLAITCVALPVANFPVLNSVRQLVQPYMLWIGLFQTWDMFGPDPRAINSYVKAVVMTQDHHMRIWSFPRMEELGFAERYRKERYRKFLDILPEPQNAPLWPDVATHVARQFNNQTDPPDKILLIEFRSDIRPGATNSQDSSPQPNVFYDDYVQPGELQ